MPKPPAPDAPGAVTTAATRLQKEPLDRVLGRLSAPQQQSLAFTYLDTLVHDLGPRVLDHVGVGATAAQLRTLPPCPDAVAAARLRDALVELHRAADARRRKEEEKAGGLADGPATREAHVLSLCAEAARAALGEGGLKVNVAAAPAGGVAKPAAVGGGTSRALVVGRLSLAVADGLGKGGRDLEEPRLKVQAQAALKSRGS